jgi:hypothetical protein
MTMSPDVARPPATPDTGDKRLDIARALAEQAFVDADITKAGPRIVRVVDEILRQTIALCEGAKIPDGITPTDMARSLEAWMTKMSLPGPEGVPAHAYDVEVDRP